MDLLKLALTTLLILVSHKYLKKLSEIPSNRHKFRKMEKNINIANIKKKISFKI